MWYEATHNACSSSVLERDGKNTKKILWQHEDKISPADWPIWAADLLNNGLPVK